MKELSKTSSLPLALLGLSALGANHAEASRWPSVFNDPFFGDWPFEMQRSYHNALPSLNMVETKDKYIVRVELPGMKKEDISIIVDQGMLTVSGERSAKLDDDQARYRIRENSFGRFSRSVSLPRDADPDKVSASFEDGLLTVTLQRNESLKPKEVKIK